MPFATSAGATLHYTVEGNASETLLLLMGLGGHSSEWGEPFVAELARHYRVIRMDNRGIGQSSTAAESWTLEDMAADGSAVLDANGCPRAHVLGTSMGGMVAQVFALRYPERVARLVLMATSFGGRESVPPEARAAHALVPQPGLSVAEQRRLGLRALTADGFAEAHAPLVDMLVEQRARNPTLGRVFKAQLDALLISDRAQSVSGIHCPTLVIHGDQDPLVPIHNGRMLSERIVGALFVTIEHCGHMPHLEKPIESASAIHAFLQ